MLDEAIKRENQQASTLDPRDMKDVAKSDEPKRRPQPVSNGADRDSRTVPRAKTIATEDEQKGERGTLADPDRSKATGEGA